jgi:hypothetical protein
VNGTFITRRVIERVAENRIREAMDQGLFDDLPGHGRPLPDLDEPYHPMWWVRSWIRRERLHEDAPPMDPAKWRAMLFSVMKAWLPDQRL